MVQGTESHELGALTRWPASPILLSQVIEQRESVFESFEILAHGAFLPLETSLRERGQRSQARMVGETENFSAPQRPENLQDGGQCA
jgi:hypothetical protein